MPKFSETPLESNEDVENWLKFYEMEAPFMNLSVFVSRDPVSLVNPHALPRLRPHGGFLILSHG